MSTSSAGNHLAICEEVAEAIATQLLHREEQNLIMKNLSVRVRALECLMVRGNGSSFVQGTGY